MKSIITYFIVFISLNAFAQNNYSYWDAKLGKDENLKKLMILEDLARKRLETNYYGNDIKLLKGANKDNVTSEAKFVTYLKSKGFHKAEEYAKSMFERQKLVMLFRKENPEFFKLDKDIQFKLIKKYAFSNLPYGEYL